MQLITNEKIREFKKIKLLKNIKEKNLYPKDENLVKAK